MSIRVNNVSKFYGNQKALNDISFEVKPGEIVGFLGPNGAGKSTMMKIICGYIPQNEGDVAVCGMNILDDELKIKQGLGYLPENNPLYLDMYVKEYLEFIGGVFQISDLKKSIESTITMVGLDKEQHKKIGALSKGYRQRVGLAQAFLNNPEVLILDEPTTGLDPNQIVEIRDLIKKIGKDKTVLLSTHIMQEVEAICDRAIIINEGQIVADQQISDLKKASASKSSLQIEFSEDVLLKDLEGAFPSAEIKSTSNKEYLMTSSDLSALKKELMKYSIENNLEISNLTEKSEHLEDIFRKLTKKN